MPKWVDEEPQLLPGDEFYLQAFFRLSTCRRLGMAMGPIPWDQVMAYADRHGLDRDVTQLFESVIYALDEVWHDWQEQQRERHATRGQRPMPGAPVYVERRSPRKRR